MICNIVFLFLPRGRHFHYGSCCPVFSFLAALQLFRIYQRIHQINPQRCRDQTKSKHFSVLLAVLAPAFLSLLFLRFHLTFAEVCKQLYQPEAAGKRRQHDQIHHIRFPPLPDDSNTIPIKTGLTGDGRN